MDPRDPGDSRRALMILAAIGLLGLVMLGGVLIWLSQRGGGESQEVADAMRAAGCTYRTTANQGRDHIRDGMNVKYKDFPPTSGNHYAVPVVWSAYDAPIEQERVIHNLEHGGIVIQYGKDVPQATVDELRDEYQSDPNGLVLAPLPSLDNQIAYTAWMHLAKCRSFDKDAFETFRDAYRAKGPEQRRVSDLAPGTAN